MASNAQYQFEMDYLLPHTPSTDSSDDSMDLANNQFPEIIDTNIKTNFNLYDSAPFVLNGSRFENKVQITTANNNDDDDDDDDDDIEDDDDDDADDDDIEDYRNKQNDEWNAHFESPDDPIYIDLSKDMIDSFHSNMYEYYKHSRLTETKCKQSYEILCTFSRIWQHALLRQDIIKKCGNDDMLHDSNYKIIEKYTKSPKDQDMGLCAPDLEIRIYKNGVKPLIYSRLIPSANIFGSVCTGLEHESSDIDITLPASIDTPSIDIVWNKREEKQKLNVFLSSLYAYLDQQKSVENSEQTQYSFTILPILSAKVPIVKITECNIGLEMDIAIETKQHWQISNLINVYCDHDDRVRPLIVSVKHWSKQRCICDAMNNYPNSFGYVLLCIKFLQSIDPPILPIYGIENIENIANIDNQYYASNDNENTSTLLELLASFFDMFHRFDFDLLSISTTRFGLESKVCHEYYQSFKYQHQSTLIIEDPSQRSSNVARNVKPYRLSTMKQEFVRAYNAVKHGDWDSLMKHFETTVVTEANTNHHSSHIHLSKTLIAKLNWFHSDANILQFCDSAFFQKEMRENRELSYWLECNLNDFIVLCKYFMTLFIVECDTKKIDINGLISTIRKSNNSKFKYLQTLLNCNSNSNEMRSDKYYKLSGLDGLHCTLYLMPLLYKHTSVLSVITYLCAMCFFVGLFRDGDSEENDNHMQNGKLKQLQNKEWINKQIKEMFKCIGIKKITDIELYQILKQKIEKYEKSNEDWDFFDGDYAYANLRESQIDKVLDEKHSEKYNPRMDESNYGKNGEYIYDINNDAKIK